MGKDACFIDSLMVAASKIDTCAPVIGEKVAKLAGEGNAEKLRGPQST